MKLAINLITFASTWASVTAQGAGGAVGPEYPSVCGYYLVNDLGKTQSEIAYLACGRLDTCNGREWNTVFSMGLTGAWYAQQFCSEGCCMYDSNGNTLAACH